MSRRWSVVGDGTLAISPALPAGIDRRCGGLHCSAWFSDKNPIMEHQDRDP